MTISDNLQRAHEWAEIRRDQSLSEDERQAAHLNEALFERDYLAEVLRFVSPKDYGHALRLLYPLGAVALEDLKKAGGMSDIEFIERLPDQIVYSSGKDLVEFQKDRDGTFCIWTGDEHYDVTMSWESWVAFAREIIATDYAARVGGGGV